MAVVGAGRKREGSKVSSDGLGEVGIELGSLEASLLEDRRDGGEGR